MSVWLLKLVHSASRNPAPGIPVTLLDRTGNPAGYWVSDAAGIVTVPRQDAATITLRVGLRNEDPITLDTERLSREIVEIDAPRSFVPATAPAGAGTTRSRMPTADRDVPGHVLHFVRLAMLQPEQRLLPAPAASDSDRADFLEIADPHNTELRYGALVDVEQYWQPLGHVSGELLYSVALGPGDEARVGIADGRWPEGARRPLDTLATLIGSSVAVRSTGDHDLALEPFTIAWGESLDTSLTHAATETMQWLGDRAQRAAQGLRRRPLRVIELGDAPVPPGSAVRKVRAPADSGVTYHFFEPLTRYRVATRAAQLRPAVLVPFRLPHLGTRAIVRRFGYILRRNLLDPTLVPEIDELLGLGETPGKTGAGVDPGAERLFAHLASHLPYYAGTLIAGGDPGVRYLALARLQDASGRSLADLVDNQVAAVIGNYLAFPLRSPLAAPRPLQEALERCVARPPRGADEIVVTVPVPGVWISRQEEAAQEDIEADDPVAESPVVPARRKAAARHLSG